MNSLHYSVIDGGWMLLRGHDLMCCWLGLAPEACVMLDIPWDVRGCQVCLPDLESGCISGSQTVWISCAPGGNPPLLSVFCLSLCHSHTGPASLSLSQLYRHTHTHLQIRTCTLTNTHTGCTNTHAHPPNIQTHIQPRINKRIQPPPPHTHRG